jgi:GNAT superfamily N-acetyltransferase
MTRVAAPIAFEVRELTDISLETSYGQAGYDLVFDELHKIEPEQFTREMAGAAAFTAVQPQTDRLLGVAYMHMDKVAPPATSTAHLRYLVVLKRLQRTDEQRGHGIGKTLLQACEMNAIAHNMNRIRLDPVDTALDFYKKYGYRMVPGQKHMEKRLGSSTIPDVIFPY